MALLVLAAFILVPLAEIAVFIQAGEWIGLGWTLVAIVATAMLGTAMLRQQGIATLRKAQKSMDHGEMPVGELFTGLCLLVAGALLLTPGFITDSIGFALLVPPVRLLLGVFVLKRLVKSPSAGVWVNGQRIDPAGAEAPFEQRETSRSGPETSGASGGRDDGPVVIDGDFEEVDTSSKWAKPKDPDERRDR